MTPTIPNGLSPVRQLMAKAMHIAAIGLAYEQKADYHAQDSITEVVILTKKNVPAP